MAKNAMSRFMPEKNRLKMDFNALKWEYNMEIIIIFHVLTLYI